MSAHAQLWGFCGVCARVVALRIPAGGDGTGLFPFRHKKPNGEKCEGWIYEADEKRGLWAARPTAKQLAGTVNNPSPDGQNEGRD